MHAIRQTPHSKRFAVHSHGGTLRPYADAPCWLSQEVSNLKKHNRAFLLVFTILFGMVSTFGTVSFATETPVDPSTNTRQPSQTPSTTNQNRPTTSREEPEEEEESSSETSSEPEESSSSVSLPSVSVPDDSSLLPSSSMAPTSNRTLNWIGIIAWVCIGLGVIVVVIVILSNRRPPRGGSGRKRYRRPKRRKKHLLNDKYYRNLKY